MSEGYYNDCMGADDRGSQEHTFRSDSVNQERAASAHDLGRTLQALSALGPVLWLHRAVDNDVFPRARLTPHDIVLLDHPALSKLADCVRVEVSSSVTCGALRESLRFQDAQGNALAKAYLLPDTNFQGLGCLDQRPCVASRHDKQRIRPPTGIAVRARDAGQLVSSGMAGDRRTAAYPSAGRSSRARFSPCGVHIRPRPPTRARDRGRRTRGLATLDVPHARSES